MQIGQVAHVHDPESEARNGSRATLQQTLNNLDRTEVRLRQHRSEHRAGKDGRQSGPTGMPGHEIPRRTFRQYLRSSIGIELPVGWIRPYGFVADAIRAVRRSGGSRGRRHHHAPDARLHRSPKHPHRPVTRRNDQRIRIPGCIAAERRGDVKYVVAPRHRIVPAIVCGQIGGEESQPIGRVGAGSDCRPHRRFFRQVAHGGAYLIAALQKLDDAPAGNESSAAGYQHDLRAIR